MIKRFTDRVGMTGTHRRPPTREETPIPAERHRAAIHWFRIWPQQPHVALAKQEPKAVRRARKEKIHVAAALNLFDPATRRDMLDMAAQLSDFKDAVAPTWAAMKDDACGPRVACFRLQLNERGDVFVEEKIRHRVSPAAVEQESAHVFSPDQLRRGAAQLHAAFIWQSENDAGFHQARPDFAPLSVAAALSED